MRKLLMSVMVLGGLTATSERASAWQWGHNGPWAQTAAFPCANPPGWYTNTYSFAWQYPWFAYYNYSHGPYANWMAGGGHAHYSTCTGHPVTYGPGGIAGMMMAPGTSTGTPISTSSGTKTETKSETKSGEKEKIEPKTGTTTDAGKVTVILPADARLLFNGAPAIGTGSVRTFSTTPLQPGQNYSYELTAEVVRDGKTERRTERVIVRAGYTSNVTLALGGTR